MRIPIYLRRTLVALALLPALGAPAGLRAQASPIRSVLSGYGAVGYSATLEDGGANGFDGLLAPVPLFKVGDDLLVEGELELAFHDAETLVVLEHLQLHYLGFDRLQFKAGRFHVPMGVWNHTSWINRLPSPPLLYQDTHGEAARGTLLPIPFDLGAMAKWTLPALPGWRTSLAAWVSQGPRPAAGGHTHEEEEASGTPEAHGAEEAAPDAPGLAYGFNFEDNNDDKMVGLRLRSVSGPELGLTLQASGFRARYDDAGELGISGGNVAVIWAPRHPSWPRIDLRAEGTLLRQEYVHHDGVETARSKGYYVQISRRFGDLEPVARWSHLPRSLAGHAPLVEKRRQLALGVIWWLAPSAPLKLAYDVELDASDRLLVEWATGF